MQTYKRKLIDYYEKNELKVDIAFFLGGFVFDVFTLSDIDDPLSIAQQLLYFFIIGYILYYDFLERSGVARVSERWNKIWEFRHPILHFFLGSILSVYSLFFLKSSSFFTSMVFVLILMGLMVANELKIVQKKSDIKVALYFICVFSFFSMIFPVLLGYVGTVPFFLAFLMTSLCVYGVYKFLQKKINNTKLVIRSFFVPSGLVTVLFFLFYFIGWIPPVPLSVQNMGVYHSVEKVGGQYILSHEKPWWKFWRTGDQDFTAEPGDKVYFFAQVYSPARFDDSVILHWYFKDPRQGWMSTDRVPMRVTGGREEGFRGFAVKQNYSAGDWRISVETTDQREIGRLYFEITQVPNKNSNRVFQKISF